MKLMWMLAVASLVASPCAQAAGKDAKERAARKACMAGDYARGVDLLADLFVDTKDPTYIYNKGRCYEQNSRYVDAVGSFREYLRSAGLSGAETADVNKHIADCEALLAKQEARTAPTAAAKADSTYTEAVEHRGIAEVMPPASDPSRTTAPTAPVVEPVASASSTVPTRPLAEASPPAAPSRAATPVFAQTMPAASAAVVEGPSSLGKGLRIAGITCGTLGLASIGTAVYYYTRANSLSDKVTNGHPAKPSDYQAGKDSETMQWVFYGVGGGAVAAGLALYWLGVSASAGSASVGVAPIAMPGMTGLSAHGVF